MKQVPAYSFSVEKGSKKTKVLKAKSANSAGWPVFSISDSSFKPHLTFTRANNRNHVVATVRFHSLSSKIDITIHGRPIQLKKKDGAHCFYHPTAGELRWKDSGFLSTKLTLMDANGLELCRYKKRDGFDVFVQVDHAFMDMILVTGFAMATYMKMVTEGAAEGVGAAGDVVAAVAGV